MAVCFIGHRTIADGDAVYSCLFATVETLIREGHSKFLLGSRSEFNSMAVSILKELKPKYPHIERIYVRAEYPHINEDYRSFLLESCDDTFFPEALLSAGRAIYAERNQILIDESSICVFYYDSTYALPPTQSNRRLIPQNRKSGTHIAYDYAVRKGKTIINLYK